MPSINPFSTVKSTAASTVSKIASSVALSFSGAGERPEESLSPASAASPVGINPPGPGTGGEGSLSLRFLGNYAPTLSAGAREVAAAFGVHAQVVSPAAGKPDRLVVLEDRPRSAEVRSFLESETEKARDALKSWQKEHASERRGLTDMKKFNQNREFLGSYMTRLAAQVSNSRPGQD